MANTVMIIDNHHVLRSALASFLAAHGFDVIEAEDGQEGLNIFHEEKPSLVITDINMPAENGTNVADEILASENDTSLFVVSELTESGTAFKTAQGLGATRYFAKPLNLIELCQAISEVFTD